MQRLFPDSASIALDEQLAGFEPASEATEERPFVYSNFAMTIDGLTTIDGRSGQIGSDADTAMLMGLRASADAVLVGAGTIREERYGRLLPGAGLREGRERRGRAADPLAVVVSGSLELPWDAGLFTCGAGRVIAFTSADIEPPATETPLQVIRHPNGVDLGAALAHLRQQEGVRALLCEGGPGLHTDLIAAGLLDELFVTLGPKLGGGGGPSIVERLESGPIDLELRWLLQEGDELFARYALRRGGGQAGG